MQSDVWPYAARIQIPTEKRTFWNRWRRELQHPVINRCLWADLIWSNAKAFTLFEYFTTATHKDRLFEPGGQPGFGFQSSFPTAGPKVGRRRPAEPNCFPIIPPGALNVWPPWGLLTNTPFQHRGTTHTLCKAPWDTVRAWWPYQHGAHLPSQLWTSSATVQYRCSPSAVVGNTKLRTFIVIDS